MLSLAQIIYMAFTIPVTLAGLMSYIDSEPGSEEREVDARIFLLGWAWPLVVLFWLARWLGGVIKDAGFKRS